MDPNRVRDFAAEDEVKANMLRAILEGGVYDLEKMVQLAFLTGDFSPLNFPIEAEQKQVDLFEHIYENYMGESYYVLKIVRRPCNKLQALVAGLDWTFNDHMHREVLETNDWLNTYTDPRLIDRLENAEDSDDYPVHRFCKRHDS